MNQQTSYEVKQHLIWSKTAFENRTKRQWGKEIQSHESLWITELKWMNKNLFLKIDFKMLVMYKETTYFTFIAKYECTHKYLSILRARSWQVFFFFFYMICLFCYSLYGEVIMDNLFFYQKFHGRTLLFKKHVEIMQADGFNKSIYHWLTTS